MAIRRASSSTARRPSGRCSSRTANSVGDSFRPTWRAPLNRRSCRPPNPRPPAASSSLANPPSWATRIRISASPPALEVLLRGQFPGHQIQVVNVAMTAINSHAVRETARDCVSREGEVWVIYLGNNEVISPFGAGTIFGWQAPPWLVVRLGLELKRSRFGQRLWPRRGAVSACRWRHRGALTKPFARMPAPSQRTRTPFMPISTGETAWPARSGLRPRLRNMNWP